MQSARGKAGRPQSALTEQLRSRATQQKWLGADVNSGRGWSPEAQHPGEARELQE